MNKNIKYEAQFNQVPNIPFHIERYSDQNPHSMQAHHYHDCYELYYLYSGERYYFIQDKTYHITGGTFILLSPHEIHSTGNLGKSGFDRMLIHFNKELIHKYIDGEDENIYQNFENNIHVISIEPQKQNFIETLLDNMIQEYIKNNHKPNTFIKFSLIQLLLFLNKANIPSNNNITNTINNTKKIIFEIIGYINNNYFDDINLEDISKKYFLSTYYLSRTFKEITGFGFIKYINNVRIKEAKKLLMNEQLNINEIASKTGFKSNTHFGRVFKEITGLTPSIFKKLNK